MGGFTIGVKNATWIRAVDNVVAVVVDVIVAVLRFTLFTCRCGNAFQVCAIGEAIAVVVEAVGTIFTSCGYTDAREYSGAGRICAVDEAIAIVVAVIRAIFRLILTIADFGCSALRVIAIELPIAIVIDAILTQPVLTDGATTAWGSRTVRIEAVDNGIAIVILSVTAGFAARGGLAAACRSIVAGRIKAIGDAIAVVIRGICADFLF